MRPVTRPPSSTSTTASGTCPSPSSGASNPLGSTVSVSGRRGITVDYMYTCRQGWYETLPSLHLVGIHTAAMISEQCSTNQTVRVADGTHQWLGKSGQDSHNRSQAIRVTTRPIELLVLSCALGATCSTQGSRRRQMQRGWASRSVQQRQVATTKLLLRPIQLGAQMLN